MSDASDEFAAIDPAELEELEREAPSLMRVRRFATGLEHIPWFVNVGEAPSDGVRAIARAYLDGLGFPDADLAILVDWEDAALAAESGDVNSPAWEAEETLRAYLTERAADVVSEEALSIALAFVASAASAAVKDCVAESAAIWDAADEHARRAAEGAAVASSHGAALLLLAAEADPDLAETTHPMSCKQQLFELGRWPIGVAGLSFNLF